MSQPVYQTPPPPPKVPSMLYAEQPHPQAQPAPELAYQAPNGIAAQAEQQAVAPPEAVEKLAAEAALPPWPAGSPALKPLLAHGRRQRAEVMEAYGVVASSWNNTVPGDGKLATPEHVAQYYRVLAEVEDFLALVAEDKPVYQAWATSHTDDELAALFAAYASRFDQGEASRSSS